MPLTLRNWWILPSHSSTTFCNAIVKLGNEGEVAA